MQRHRWTTCLVLIAQILVGGCAVQRAPSQVSNIATSDAPKRLLLVAGNAFTVINPGYRIVLDGDAPPEREGDDYRLAVDVSPLWSDVNYSDTWPVGELAITQNAQTGKVHVPHLPITRMQSIIQQPLRAIDEASGATKRAKRLLSNIGPGVDLGAYVEYATGQTAAVISTDASFYRKAMRRSRSIGNWGRAKPRGYRNPAMNGLRKINFDNGWIFCKRRMLPCSEMLD